MWILLSKKPRRRDVFLWLSYPMKPQLVYDILCLQERINQDDVGWYVLLLLDICNIIRVVKNPRCLSRKRHVITVVNTDDGALLNTTANRRIPNLDGP